MMRLAVYMRYSTEKQELKVQQEEIEKYIEYVFKDQDIHVTKYIDEGYSGKDMKRPVMQQLQHDIISHKIDSVIALKLDRLGRSLQDLLLLFKLFEDHKINVHLVKEKIDTSTPQGRLLFHITGSFAEFERETIKDRLQSGKKYAREHGTKSGKPQHRPRKNINMNECIDLYKKGLSMNKLGKYFGVHSQTIKSRLEETGIIQT